MAQAEQAEGASQGGLGIIVVTATKRSENMQDVPVAISAISSEALTSKGVFETSDLNNSMPNLQVSSPYGSQQPNFSIRGVGVGTEFNANAASPVGVYVDEVYQTFRATHGQQLYDLEQIEVVRGPQGTLYGRNTTGGAVNFISRAPKLDGQNGYATLGYGNLNRLNIAGAVEVTPVEDVFGMRLAGTFVNADPYVTNVLPAGINTTAAGGASGLNLNTGRSPGGYKSYGFRGTFRLKPTDSVDLSLKVYASESTGGTEVAIPTGQDPATDIINYQNPNFLLNGLFQDAAFGPGGLAPLLPATYSLSGNGLTERQVQANNVGEAFTRARGVVFNAKVDLSDNLKLISITGWDDGRYTQSDTDCDGSPLSLCHIGYASSFSAFNQDVRLDFDGGAFKMIVGGYFGRDKLTSDNTPDFFNFLRDINAAVGAAPGYFDPGGAFGLGLPTGISANQHFKQVRKSYAVYGEGSYEITPSLKFTAGLRYTKDKNNFSEGVTTYFDDTGAARLITVSDNTVGGAFAPYFLQDVFLADGVTLAIPASAGPLPGPLEQSGKSGKFSGRAILDWKPTDETLVYASYSRGYRAGTFNGLAYGSSNQVYFVPPEEVDAFEAGFKTRFLDNRLQLNGSVFHYKYKGQQGQVVDNTATANLVSLDGKLTGAELDIQFQATDRLRFTGSFGWLDTKYDDGPCPIGGVAGFPAQLGNCVASSGGAVNVGGNPFPYAAKTSANVGFDWDAADIGDGVLTIHGDANYTGRFYYDSFKDYSRGPLTNVITGKFAQGSGKYTVYNARISYTTDRYTIAAWGKNLTDKTYYPFGIAIENLFGNSYRIRAEPRTYGLEATVRF